MATFPKNIEQYWWTLFFGGVLLGYWIKTLRIRNNPEYLQNQGEALVSHTLLNELPKESWHLLNNITIEVEDGTTQIDHMLVSRFGVFVIETKDYDGWIFANKKSKRWMQITRYGKYPFQNPLHQNFKHLKATQALLDFLPSEQITGIVVFTNTAEFKTNCPEGVYSVTELITYLKSLKVECLSENKMQFCIGRLECKRLALTRETDIKHQAYLQTRNSNKLSNTTNKPQ
jgi:hypothetical protein